MTRYLFYDDEIANSKQYICSLGYVRTDDKGNEIELDLTVTQEQIVPVLTPFFQRAIDICKKLH